MPITVTRRSSLAGLAAAAVGGGQQKRSGGSRAVPVGVATTDFRDHTNGSLAEELKSQRVRRIQLFFTQKDSPYWKYGARSDLNGMTPERAREIASIYRAAGIEGIRQTTSNPVLTLPDDARQIPDVISQALSELRLAGVDGPYSVLLSADAYTAVSETTEHGYPIREHLNRLVDATSSGRRRSTTRSC